MVTLDGDGSILKQQPLFVAGLNAWLHPRFLASPGASTPGLQVDRPFAVARLQDIPEGHK